MPRQKSTHVDSPEAVGRRLREAREKAGLSQRQLAFAGCSPAYISRIEAGDRTPSLQLLRELGKRLGVSADWLATGAEVDPAADPLLEAKLALRLGALGSLGGLALQRGDTSAAVRQLEEARGELGDAVLAQPGVVEALGEAYAI